VSPLFVDSRKAHGHYIRFPATIRIENEYRVVSTKPHISGVYLVLIQVQAPIRKVDKTVVQIRRFKDAVGH
jgi:predicted nucleic acid-binding protein